MVPKCDLQYKNFNNTFIFNYVYKCVSMYVSTDARRGWNIK